MPYDVFLSYNSQDHVAVEEIARRLHARDIRCYLDRWYLPKGQPWRLLLEQTLADSRAVAVFVGPNGMGPWQHREIDVALDIQARNPGFPVVPVLLQGSEPPLGFLGQNTWIDHRNQPLDRVVQLLEKSIRREAHRPDFEEQFAAAKSAVCPYRGLLYFREEDAPFFFGREAAVDELCKAVDRTPFVAVVGASGSGKSSVVRAGLAPRLRRDRNTVWEISSLVPGDEPLKSLAGAVVPLLLPELNLIDQQAEINKLAMKFAEREISLRDMVRRVLGKQTGTQRLLLIADQWEELYTLTKDDSQRRRFLDELLDATARSPLTVVLTLRGDFVGSALKYRPLSDRLQNAQVNLGPMTADELGLAVRMPAREAGLEFQEGLDTQILADVGDEPGNLPLLEFVLRELWEKRQGNQLLHASYKKMGGLQGAVAAKAEALFTRLSLPEQEATRLLFLQLVHASEEGNYTRHREKIADIPRASHELVKKMADERLLITGGGTLSGEETVEVAHEALIWHWERLTGWLNKDPAFLLWRERLRAYLEAWKNSNQNEELLLRGPVLAEAEGWLLERSESLTEEQRGFIQASVKERVAREEAERLQRRRLLEAEQEKAREAELRAAAEKMRADEEQKRAAAEQRRAEEAKEHARKEGESRQQLEKQRKRLLIVAVLTVIFGVVALIARRNAEQALAEANRQLVRAQVEEGRAWIERSKLNASRGDNFAAALMAARAVGFSGWGRESAKDARFENANPILLDAKNAEDRIKAHELVFNATSNSPTKFPLWQSPIVQNHTGRVNSVSWSPDGKTLASGSEDHTVKLWKVSTGELLSILEGHAGSVTSVTWSPDGRMLVSGATDGKARLWDPDTGKLLISLAGHTWWVNSVSWSSDGKMLASGGWDKTVKLWEVSTGKLLSSLEGHTGPVLSVTWSPDGRTLASGSWDRTVKLWEVSTGKMLSTLKGHMGNVSSLMWSPNGKILASGAEDSTVKLWDVSAGKMLSTLKGHMGDVSSVTWSPDGRTLASGGVDRMVKLWDAGTGKLLSTLEGHKSEVTSVTWSPDGKMLAAGGGDRTVKLWEVSTGKMLPTLDGHTGGITTVTWSPNGRTLASGCLDSKVKLWDAGTGKLRSTLDGHKGEVSSVTWSPDGRMLATGSEDNTVKLWDAGTGKLQATLQGHTRFVSSVAWSPDGRTLASAGWDKTVKQWELSTGKLLTTWEGHAGSVSSVAWSPDGRTLASGSWDKTVKLWEVSTGNLLTTLVGHTDVVTNVMWSPDGRTLAAGSWDNTVKVWEVNTGNLLITLVGHTGAIRGISWSPDGRALASGSWDRTVKLWEVSTGNLLTTLEGHAGSVSSVSWCPDGRALASGSEDNMIRVWEVSTSSLPSTLEGHTDFVTSASWSPDGRMLASGGWDNNVKLWNVSTGYRLITLEGHAGYINSVSWSPDGKTLASGSEDNTVKVWDMSTGNLLATLDGHAGSVSSVTWSSDGRMLASGSRDNTVKVWEVRTGDLLTTLEGHAGSVRSVSWNPKGKTLASGADDNTVKVWEVRTGNLLTTLGHTGFVTSVSWSPDGKMLAAGDWDNIIKIWEMSTGKLLTALEGHSLSVNSVSWSPNGRTLASGGGGNTVKLWEVKTGKQLTTMERHRSDVTVVTWSPDGKTLATGGGDTTVKLWSVPIASETDLATYFRGRWVKLNGGELGWINVNDSLFHERTFPVVNVRVDSLIGLENLQLPGSDRNEAEMRILLAAQNFPSAVSVWSAQAAKTPADAASRRFFLSAASAQAAADWEKDLHWRAVWLTSQVTPAFTTESFADPSVSLGALRLAKTMVRTNSTDPQFTSTRDALIARLKTVAPSFWQEAFDQVVQSPSPTTTLPGSTDASSTPDLPSIPNPDIQQN